MTVALPRDATSLQSRKRQLSVTFAHSSLPAKRAQPAGSDTSSGRRSTMSVRWVKHANVSSAASMREAAMALLALRYPVASGHSPGIVPPPPTPELLIDVGAANGPPPPELARLIREKLEQFNSMVKSEFVGGKGPASASSSRAKRATGERKSMMQTISEPSFGFEAQALTSLPKDVGFNNGQSAPQPNLTKRFHRQEFGLFPTSEPLGGPAVLFNDEKNSATLPHLAEEWKGPGKDMIKAGTQSVYDGVDIVDGGSQTPGCLGITGPPRPAGVRRPTTSGTSVNPFRYYAAPLEKKGKGKLEYHQNSIDSTNLANSLEGSKATLESPRPCEGAVVRLEGSA
jgi:hypothetical protein